MSVAGRKADVLGCVPLAEPPEVRYSDFTAGAYIYARLRKKPERGGKA